MNPESDYIPDIGSIKKSIEYQNYLYNQQQLQRRNEVHKKLKQHEIQQIAYQNHQDIIQLENEKIQSMRKKYQVQDILQRQYNQQIYSRHRIKTEEKSVDKVYNQLQKEMLENYQRNRLHQMSKIYQIGNNTKNQITSNSNKRKLLTEGCEDSLDYFRQQSVEDFRVHRRNIPAVKIQSQQTAQITHQYHQQSQFPRIESGKQQKYSLSQIEQTSPLINSRQKKHSAYNLNYGDYLKRQIDRKQKEKQLQKQKQLNKDKTWIDRQNQSYSENLEQMKYLSQKKKYDYASGLDKQLYLKRNYQRL